MNWWLRLVRRRHMEAQLERELRFHVEHHVADLIARGYEPSEARRRARLELGGVEQVKERCRDARGTRWLEDLTADIRYAVRGLRSTPTFTAVVVLTLALGGGATTIMFAIVNGVLLKPFPYPQPDRLVRVEEQTDWSTALGNRWAFAYLNYVDCKRDARNLTLAAFRFVGGTVSEPGDAEFVNGRQVSWDFLPMLGAAIVHGRHFNESEDRIGAEPVMIISHAIWQRHFGGRPSAIGEPLVFDGQLYTVIGITPADFRIPGDPAVFTLLGQNREPRMQNREVHPGIQVWARLRDGATLEVAQAELHAIGRRLEEQYPKSNAGRTFVAEPLRPPVDDVASTLWLSLGAVAVVLLIACVNIAALLLTRAIARDREMAMRAALGAGRGRLIRQCLAESSVLGLTGGTLGIVIAAFGVRQVVTLWPGGVLPRADEVHVDPQVLAFAIGVSLLTGILFGLAPAMRVSVRGLEQALRSTGRAVSGGGRRLHSVFVVAEIALAIVLVLCATVLGRTLLRLSSVDPGVDRRNVLIARVALSPSILSSPAAARAAWHDVLTRAKQVPGVHAVAMVDTVPLRAGNNQLGYQTTAATLPSEGLPLTLATSVTPEYLKVMGIALRYGRFFDDSDRSDSPPVVVIDEVLAQQAFGQQNAVGKSLWVPQLRPGPVEVVGVVRHVRHWGPVADDDSTVRAQLYYPFAQLQDTFVRRWSELMSIAVRTTTPPLGVVNDLRRELRATARDQVLYQVRTMEELASATVDRQRFLWRVFGVFAAVAVLLACIGVYGVLSYLTNQRAPEFGVRLALGATTGNVMRLVLGQGMAMILAGATIGTLAAVAAGRVLERAVDGVRPTGVATFASVIVVLMAAALMASVLPARRASRLDAMTTLRQE